MEQLKWTTVTSWVDETLEIFNYIDENYDLEYLSNKVNNGEIYGDRKENSAKRVFNSIKARYLNNEKETVVALSNILKSNITYQERCNYLYIFYLEYETLAQLFMERYIYDNFNNYGQKIYTQMDLDKFFEIVLSEYRDKLPEKLNDGITEKSMLKVRNCLYKNIEYFGWIETDHGKFTIKRPKLTAEWFVFTLYLFFENKTIDAKDVYHSQFYKRFLLNEYDIDYLITSANIKGLIETNKLGDINTITKRKEGLSDYANSYR